jgi:hypothetical protein
MTIGGSLFLLAVGAILKYAVQDSIEGVDLTTVGLILMIVGAIGLAFGIWQTQRLTRDEPPVTRRDPYDRA